MITTAICVALLLVSPAAPAPAPQQPRPAATATADVGERLTLSELFGLLRGKSPRMEAERAKVDLAKARLATAKVFPNPIFNFQLLQLVSGYNQNGLGTYTVYLQQPIYIGGQRITRRKAARAQQTAAEAAVTETFHQLAAEGRHAFVELLTRQDHHHVLETAVTDLERVRDIVAGRHAAGAESKYDVARIDVEVSKWRAKIATSNADIRDASGQLGVLVGRPRWRPRADGHLAQLGIDTDVEKLWPEVEQRQPAIQRARKSEHAAERDLVNARREGVPQPTLGFGMVGINNFFSMSVLAGISVPLPLFDWGQGPIARAKADVRVARAEKEAIVATSRAELDRAAAVVDERRTALAQFERDVLAQTPALQQMAEDAYVTGQASILELIDAIEMHYELEEERLLRLEEVVQAEVDLLHVLGRIEEGA